MRLTAGGSRVRSSIGSTLPKAGADSPHNSVCLAASPTDLSRGGERSGSVYLDSTANQISQPTVFEECKLTSDESVIVTEWEYSEFVWLSKFVDELPRVYERLLEVLGVDSEEYEFGVDGFYAYCHERDPRRRCSVDRIYLPLVTAGRYHPYHSFKHRCRASSRALERLEFLQEKCRKRRVKFDYLIKIDLTLPKQVSELWDSEKVDCCVREAVKEFLRLLHEELFPGHHSQFGVIANHHYWATRTPLEPHRHIHLTIPNVTYNKSTGMFHRIRPWIDEGVVKECWQQALKGHGLWVDVPDYIKPDVFVGYIEFAKRDKVMHRLSYCSRKPIEDLAINLTYRQLGGFDKEFAWFLLDYTPRRINLGFMCNLKRFGYSHKQISLRCPVCGGEMVLERDENGRPLLYDRPPPLIPKLYRDRRGTWQRVLE